MIGAMAATATSPAPSTGWDALRAAEWKEARAAFESELAAVETASVLDGLARARWWMSDISGAVEAWERAYTACRRDGQDEAAAHLAVLLAREHAEGLGNDALANGWLARAKAVLADYPDSVEWGWVALVESERASIRSTRSNTLNVRSPLPGELGTRIWSWPLWAGPGSPRSLWAWSKKG